ncbi:hypothetical protein [Diaminobutyricimonas sp. TR449]|uniref:hypothetical protein n=1 Tax=Diaminobutyricimonas sp. TR449 TaxID=2708076 RepID=UPI00141DBB3F|nr:hypothetical protein [Diaminobutyricimonas sp. TR449]
MPKDAIDPRYNPAFQRGYDRSRHGTEPHLRAAEPVERIPRDITRAMPGPTVVPPPVPAPPQNAQTAASAPYARPLGAPGATRQADQAAPGPFGTDQSVDARSTIDPDVEPDASRGMVLRGNPFVIVLLGVGAALTVFGIWAQWQIADLYAGTNRDPDSFILQQFFVTVGPWCMTLGIATLVTVLVLYALHWRAPQR